MRRELPLVGALLAALIVALQVAAGAYHAEFGQDEASHYVSGLFLHDFLLSGFSAGPLDYLRQYHAHYPLVGIGHWPPLYYAVEAVWMLLFSPARGSVLLLSAGMTLATALLLYGCLAPRCGRLVAAGAAALFVAAPIIQGASAALMLDVPVALLCLLAMLSYRRFLDDASLRAAVPFALLAAAALLVKGTGGCLALLPACAVLIGRRFDLLARPAFWLPLPVVAVLAGPWYWLTYGRVAAGFRFAWGFDYVAAATRANALSLVHALGLPVVLLGLAGLALVIAQPRRSGPLGVAAAALFVAVWLFQTVIPAALEDRYLAPALPPLLLLAGEALLALRARLGAPALAGAVVLAAVLFPFALVGKPHSGIAEAVAQVLAQPVAGNPAVLIAADADGETAAVAEIAMHDTARPHLFAVRGSRLLGGGGYNNADYVPRYASVAEVTAAIDAAALPTVLLRDAGGPHAWAHVRQVAEAAGQWQGLGAVSVAGQVPVLLYRLVDNAARPANTAGLLELSAPRGL